MTLHCIEDFSPQQCQPHPTLILANTIRREPSQLSLEIGDIERAIRTILDDDRIIRGLIENSRHGSHQTEKRELDDEVVIVRKNSEKILIQLVREGDVCRRKHTISWFKPHRWTKIKWANWLDASQV